MSLTENLTPLELASFKSPPRYRSGVIVFDTKEGRRRGALILGPCDKTWRPANSRDTEWIYSAKDMRVTGYSDLVDNVLVQMPALSALTQPHGASAHQRGLEAPHSHQSNHPFRVSLRQFSRTTRMSFNGTHPLKRVHASGPTQSRLKTNSKPPMSAAVT